MPQSFGQRKTWNCIPGTVLHVIYRHKESGFIGALKIFKKQDFRSRSLSQNEHLQNILIKELKIQSFANHSHILKVYSIFSDEKCVYLFMELGTEGQLFDKMQKKKIFKEESISFLMRGLLEASKYLHAQGIIHRDLKPQNIVLIHVLLCLFRVFLSYVISVSQLSATRTKENYGKLYAVLLCTFPLKFFWDKNTMKKQISGLQVH